MSRAKVKHGRHHVSPATKVKITSRGKLTWWTTWLDAVQRTEHLWYFWQRGRPRSSPDKASGTSLVPGIIWPFFRQKQPVTLSSLADAQSMCVTVHLRGTLSSHADASGGLLMTAEPSWGKNMLREEEGKRPVILNQEDFEQRYWEKLAQYTNLQL